MNLLPRDYTKQENIIAKSLSKFGIRYEQQYEFIPYTVDFYIPDLNMVIEADGKYGHLQKRDTKRDLDLVKNHAVEYILHVRDFTKERVESTLWLGLNKLKKPDLPSNNERPQ